MRGYKKGAVQKAFIAAREAKKAGERVDGLWWMERWLERQPDVRVVVSRERSTGLGAVPDSEAARKYMAAKGRNVDGSPLAPPEKSDNEDIIE